MKSTILKNNRNQHTLKKKVSYTGIGVHTGVDVTMTLLPEAENVGVYFKRTDLPGHPCIPAHVDYVVDTSRCTVLGDKDVCIYTVEHVLAALRAYNIDNVCIELSNMEPPVGNGSSDVFVEMIEEAGIKEQKSQVSILSIKEPIYYADETIQVVALPYEGYRISFTLNYPGSPVLDSQFFTSDINQDTFKKEIAPCRTFSLYEEVSMLMDKGLIKGGSLDNAVVIKGDEVFSKGSLFFPNEMVRHKTLDVIGDLSLVGVPFNAHIIAIRSGHSANYLFAKKLFKFINFREKSNA